MKKEKHKNQGLVCPFHVIPPKRIQTVFWFYTLTFNIFTKKKLFRAPKRKENTFLGTNISPPKALSSEMFSFSQGEIRTRSLQGNLPTIIAFRGRGKLAVTTSGSCTWRGDPS